MKAWIKKIFGFGLASFFSDLSHEMTISLIPILVETFVGVESAPFFLGIIASCSDAFSSFLRLFSGILTDRLRHKKPLIACGYLISAFFTAFIGFTQSIGQLLLCRIISFTGSGLREPPRDVVIASIITPDSYGRAFGLRNAMDTMGSILGPLITFWIISYLSIKQIFMLSAIPGLLAVISILFLTKDVVIFEANHVHRTTLWQDCVQIPVRFWIHLLIILIFQLSCFNKLLLVSRTQEIIIDPSIDSIKLVVFLYTILNTTRACMEFLIGFVSDFINRDILLAVFGCGTFALASLMLKDPGLSFMSCLIVFMLFGTSSAALLTLRKAATADILPPAVRGLGYGIMQAFEGFAALVSSAFIGFLWTYVSPSIAFIYPAIGSLIAAILLLIFAFTHPRILGSEVSCPISK